jgi:deoxyribodipyrimidine photo-lyase
MPDNLQRQYNCALGRDYPMPVIDVIAAAKHAKETMWIKREGSAFRKEAQAIFETHGSRNPAREGVRRAAPKTRKSAASPGARPQQGSLFDVVG